MINEHPILFSAEMVRAILEGRKTQTRRMAGLKEINKNPDDWELFHVFEGDEHTLPLWNFRKKKDHTEFVIIKCPFGQAGENLYVRETWFEWVKGNPQNLPYLYRATTSDYDIEMTRQSGGKIIWRPSIFMPRCASRLTLEITDIRVERVQEITKEDAIKEGCDGDLAKIMAGGNEHDDPDSGLEFAFIMDEKFLFQYLWDSINEKKYPWSSNPFVWVIEFKRIKK